MIDATHDPARESWVASANVPGADFPVQNLPFVTFRARIEDEPRLGVAIGDRILDVTQTFGVASMTDVFSMPRSARRDLRTRISDYLTVFSPGADSHVLPAEAVDLMLPCNIPDYTDFYASLHHALNVGRMFRPDHPLLPNYKWIPVAYHGRASSVVVSSTPIRRPEGQIVESPSGPPGFGASRRLDYEAEVGAFLGPGNELGIPIPVNEAEDHIAGVCLLNDWSARDIQAWEYQPLGPFLSKNFATSISPWVVTLDALEPFRCAPPQRSEGDPEPLPYLKQRERGAFRILIEISLRTLSMHAPESLGRVDFSTMYWTLGQMVTHHASNGCPLRPGDLIGSGTISGPGADSRGCLLELTRNGAQAIELSNGERRGFLEDGDEVTLRGWCEAPGFRRIGLGECRGRIVPGTQAPSQI